MDTEIKESLARAAANIVAGVIIGIGKIVAAILSMVFGILMSLAG